MYLYQKGGGLGVHSSALTCVKLSEEGSVDFNPRTCFNYQKHRKPSMPLYNAYTTKVIQESDKIRVRSEMSVRICAVRTQVFCSNANANPSSSTDRGIDLLIFFGFFSGLWSHRNGIWIKLIFVCHQNTFSPSHHPCLAFSSFISWCGKTRKPAPGGSRVALVEQAADLFTSCANPKLCHNLNSTT